MSERKKGFIESANDEYMKFVALALVLLFFTWIGGCLGCKHEKTKTDERIEKSVKIVNKKAIKAWDKWIEKNDSIK